MSQLNIVNLIEQTQVKCLSDCHQSKLVNKIKENFSDNEQQLFVASFYCYLNYNKQTDFVIDLDNVWKWLDFSNKDKAKRLLEKSFIENTDYKCLLPFKGEQTHGRGGHNKETILLTVKAFKTFCLKAGTKKADQIHDYYLKLEETLQDVINEENNELRLQLENQTQQLENILRTSQSEKDLLREKTLLEQFPENTQCFYYGTIDNTNDKNEKLIKFGNSNSLRKRIAVHKKRFSNFCLSNAFKVDNKTQIENAIKNHHKLTSFKRTITIDDKNQTEILCIDNITFEELDKIIQDVIVGVEYNVDNYNKLLKSNEMLHHKIAELLSENNNLKCSQKSSNSLSIDSDYRHIIERSILLDDENKRLKIENIRLIKKFKKTDDISPADYLSITDSIKRISKGSDGLYHIEGNSYIKCFGNRHEVWNGIAYKTTGELRKHDLIQDKNGKLVSKIKSLFEKTHCKFANGK